MTLRDLIDGVGGWFSELWQVLTMQSNWLDSSILHVFWASIVYFFILGWGGASLEKLSLAYDSWRKWRQYKAKHPMDKDDEDERPFDKFRPISSLEEAFWSIVGVLIGGCAFVAVIANLLMYFDK